MEQENIIPTFDLENEIENDDNFVLEWDFWWPWNKIIFFLE